MTSPSPLPARPAAAPLLLLLALASLLGAALAQEGAPGGEVRLEARVFEIAGQLRCPNCTSESVRDSNAPVSVEMREIIQEQLAAGRSEAEVLAFFQERYGDWILLEPPRRGLHLLVWLLPPLAALLGAGLLVLFVRRWLRATRAPIEADEAELARVRELVAEDGRGEGS